MKKLLVLFIFILGINLYGQTVNVLIKVISPTIDDTSQVFIAGNIEEFGNWNPGIVLLDNMGNKTWSKKFRVPKGFRLEYKFTKGSWATEALGSDSSVPQNSVLIANSDTSFDITIMNWRDKFNFTVKGQITGKVDYHKNFVIDGLKPRDIFVWLPPGYDLESDKRYPVLYMHDGQNLVDPRKSNTFIDWQIDETADSLIRNGEIEPIIIVGINNTDNRGTEYSKTSLGELYMKLIVGKIKPFIDKIYRTLPDRLNTAVGGSSMGGLISFIIAWDYPEVFSKAACFSPAFKFRDFNYIDQIKNYTGKKKNLMFYIDNGGVGLESILQAGIDEMIETLKGKEYQVEKDFFVFIDKDAEHNETAWAKKMWRPLKLFFAK
ncbi:MAG: alpha/beta hydrolase-fold protein [Melioribacteraceae bacterium]|nr:alpha/beta hydrolase-fold protein [Melioribacteraceae bacterium]